MHQRNMQSPPVWRKRPKKPSSRSQEGVLCTILDVNFGKYPFCSTLAIWLHNKPYCFRFLDVR